MREFLHRLRTAHTGDGGHLIGHRVRVDEQQRLAGLPVHDLPHLTFAHPLVGTGDGHLRGFEPQHRGEEQQPSQSNDQNGHENRDAHAQHDDARVDAFALLGTRLEVHDFGARGETERTGVLLQCPGDEILAGETARVDELARFGTGDRFPGTGFAYRAARPSDSLAPASSRGVGVTHADRPAT